MEINDINFSRVSGFNRDNIQLRYHCEISKIIKVKFKFNLDDHMKINNRSYGTALVLKRWFCNFLLYKIILPVRELI